MTEPLIATEIRETALAEWLGETAGLTACFGALTPQQFDAPAAETGAVLTGAAVHDLGWRRRVAIRGEDRFRWLSGMVTNTVEGLADNAGAYNLVLNAQGRIQGDCYVWRNGDDLELEVTADQAEALMAHLDKFIIMDDVELVPLQGQTAIGVSGPKAAATLEAMGLPVPSEELKSTPGEFGGVAVRIYRLHGPLVPRYAVWMADGAPGEFWKAALAAGAVETGAGTVEVLRIAEGTPAYGVDIESRDLAQETSQVRALSFTKGCYLGQEIVERIRSRGQVHRHLRQMEIFPDDGALPAIGTELRIAGSPAEAKAAGKISSVAGLQVDGATRMFALGVVRAEAEVGSHELAYTGGRAVLLHGPAKLY
jgi:folate-binding protein YgfZ